MKLKHVVGLSTVALLGVASLVVEQGRNAQAEGDYGPLSPRGGFGKAICGTWITDWEIPGVASGLAITNIHEDGEFSTSNSHTHVSIANAATEERGTWIQTGSRALSTTSVKLSLTDQGDGTRSLAWIIRVRHQMVFNDSFDAMEGTVELDYFPPTADINLDAPAFTVPGGVLQGTRIQVVQ